MNLKFKLYFVLFFFLTLCSGGAAVLFFEKGMYPFAALFVILTLYLINHTLKSIFKIFRDIDDFVEAVRYHDFSKRYPETGNNRNIFYRHFNAISNTFLTLGREKETQQQYLKRMLELVDTGMLAYDIKTREVLWMNDALATMFRLPALKNIDWLKKRNEKLYTELMEIPLGESRLITINAGKQAIKTLTNASTFQTGGKTYKLIAFHNISSTLEEVEAGAWKGLLNVMTHEIMNTIAPVASLADTLKKRMDAIRTEMAEHVPSDLDDISFALETIQRRSEGLLRFADTYRSLSKTIIPELHPVNLYELFTSVYQLMNPSLQQKGILLEIKTDHPQATAIIDRNLIEQVLINFITNATFAVKGKPEPRIVLFSGITSDGLPYLTVADNGCGIPSETRDKIFIPFFSTKKNGSGIGLSLSREIVNLHKGSLQVQTQEGEGTAFTILLKE